MLARLQSLDVRASENLSDSHVFQLDSCNKGLNAKKIHVFSCVFTA